MDIESYRRELAALKEENEYLRAAAHTFGELAERLATELRRARAQADSGASQPAHLRRRTSRYERWDS